MLLSPGAEGRLSGRGLALWKELASSSLSLPGTGIYNEAVSCSQVQAQPPVLPPSKKVPLAIPDSLSCLGFVTIPETEKGLGPMPSLVPSGLTGQKRK